MQRGEEDGRERSSSRGETDGEPQDGQAAEDQADTALSAPEDQSGPDPDGPPPWLQPNNSLEEYDAQVPLTPQLSVLKTTEDMEDQMLQPQGEEEEDEDDDFLVLDPEHPLMQRRQTVLGNQLSKLLEMINQGLKGKLEEQKAEDKCDQEMGVEAFRIHEHIARFQTRLANQHENRAQAEAKHQQAQDQLERKKVQSSNIGSEETKAKANVTGLQAETDNLNLHLFNTKEVSEDLRSNVKAMKNVTSKAGAEKSQAEEQKLKQDLYVKRLTNEKERLVQQIAMYKAQGKAQAEETQEAKRALSEVEMESETLVMARKQLLQQWSSILVGMRLRDEAFSSMQEAMRAVEHQGILNDGEIESYKKSTLKEQEQNETLTVRLNWSLNDCTTSKKLIGQKQAQQETLLAHYSACLRTLKETENTLARLSKETSTHQAEHTDQRKQVEKESAVRLDFEDKIMQQGLTHSKAAKDYQRLKANKIAALKKEKISQLWKHENDAVALGLECNEVGQYLDNLTLTQEAVDQEIAKYNKLLTSNEAKVSSFINLISQKMSAITSYNKQIDQIVAKTGHEDLSPLQIRINALLTQIQELMVKVGSDKQFWMKQQQLLIEMTQEIELNKKNLLKLQAKYTVQQQNKIHLEGTIEVDRCDDTELEKNTKMLRGDLVKLSTLLSKNGQLSLALGQENALMETDFFNSLKEAEWDLIEMQMDDERTQEETKRLLNSLVEAERQIALWQRKTQLVQETRSTVEVGQSDMRMMKAEIHRMEVLVNQLLKQREQLLKESEDTVLRRENIALRHVHSSNRNVTKAELDRVVQGLKRNIKDTHKDVAECEEGSKELQESQVSLSEELAQHKKELVDLCGASHMLDTDFSHLKDTRDRDLAHLVALQSRTKKLQGVCEGRYTALSNRESVQAALQSQMDSMHAASTILHRVCEDFPQNQGALRGLSVTLTEHRPRS